MEPGTGRTFNWSLSNQNNFGLPTCVPLRINVTRQLDEPVLVPPYHLTAFVIGRRPKKVAIKPDIDDLSWTVTEPVGSKLILTLMDNNGVQGGFLPHVFDVVAGNTTECVEPTSIQSVFTLTTHVTRDLRAPESLEIGLQGGVPPYNAILFSLELSRPSVTKIRFEQTRFIYSRQVPGSSILVAAVSDSNGEWASGTSLVNFKDQKDDVPSSQTASLLSSKASESQVPSRNDTPWHITSFGSQKILTPRSSEDYGSIIIVVDGVALAVLFIATLVVILCAIFRRRNRQPSKQVGDIPLQNVGEERGVEPSQESLHDIAQQQSPPSKSSMEDTYDQFSNDLEAALPIVPQTSPIGPLSAHSTQSHMTSVHTSLVTLLGSHHPNSYGDPYPSLERETYRSDMQSRLSRKSSSGGLSFSSFRSAKTARVIGRLARFSDSTSFNEPALSDTRSGVLSRNISNSSSSTIITKDKHSSAPVPGSSVRPSWYQVSGNAPAVPPLVFKHDDL